MSESDEHSFAVTFTCDAVNEAKMRTDMVVRMIEPETAEFALATDEGGLHGGAGTAPTPLMLFAGGLTACLMTQLRAFSRRLDVEVGRIALSTRLEWRARQQGRAPYVSEPVGFAIDIEIESDAPVAEQKRLIEAAKKGCFVEQTLMRPNTIAHRLKTAEGWRDV